MRSGWVFFAASLAFLTSCSSPAKKSAEPAKKPAVVRPSDSFETNAAVSLAVSDGANLTSFAAMAKSSGKAYAVFQYSGVTCQSCQEHSPKVQADLSNLSNVARIVVFPNTIGAYTETEYQGFISQYASGADRLIDHTQLVLKSIRADKNQFFGIYVVVRASDGKAMVLNESDAHLTVYGLVKNLK